MILVLTSSECKFHNSFHADLLDILQSSRLQVLPKLIQGQFSTAASDVYLHCKRGREFILLRD